MRLEKVIHMFGAQSYGTLVNIVDRLATIPLFVSAWGVSLYGEWLVLRAIPAYLSVAEMGFATAAANRMSVLIESNQEKEALGFFKTSFVTLLLISLILILILICFLWFVDFEGFFNFSGGSDYNLHLTMYLMLGYSLLVFQTQMISAVYRSVGEYGRAAYMTYNTRLGELLGLVTVLFFGGGLTEASLAYFLIRGGGVLFMTLVVLREQDWFSYGLNGFEVKKFYELLPNALGFLLFPLGQAVSLQGALLIIANVMSPSVVAVFSITRTLSRLVVQLGMQVNRSVWPELTRLHALNKRNDMKLLFLQACSSFFWMGLIASVFLALLGPLLIYEMSSISLGFPSIILILLLIGSLINGFWFSSLSILAATDSHRFVSRCYVLIMIFSLPLLYLACKWLSIEGVGLVLLFVELVVFFLVLNKSLSMVGGDVKDLLFQILNFPLMIKNRLIGNKYE